MDEGAHLHWVLDAHARLDTAGDVYAVRPEGGHDLAHVTRFESTRDEYAAPCRELSRQLPIPGPPGAPSLVCRPGVEHDRVGPIVDLGDAALPDLQHLDHRFPCVEARRLGSVQLEQVEVDEVCDLPHLCWVLVDEDADDRRPH